MHDTVVLKNLENVIYVTHIVFKQIHVYINYIFLIKFLKTNKNFFRNLTLGSTPSVLLIWLKNYCIIYLKIELLAININMPNNFRHLCFFFGPVNKAGFPVMAENTPRQFLQLEILIKMLAASTCMIEFFCKSMAASNFCNERKSAPQKNGCIPICMSKKHPHWNNASLHLF